MLPMLLPMKRSRSPSPSMSTQAGLGTLSSGRRLIAKGLKTGAAKVSVLAPTVGGRGVGGLHAHQLAVEADQAPVVLRGSTGSGGESLQAGREQFAFITEGDAAALEALVDRVAGLLEQRRLDRGGCGAGQPGGVEDDALPCAPRAGDAVARVDAGKPGACVNLQLDAQTSTKDVCPQSGTGRVSGHCEHLQQPGLEGIGIAAPAAKAFFQLGQRLLQCGTGGESRGGEIELRHGSRMVKRTWNPKRQENAKSGRRGSKLHSGGVDR